VTLKPGLEVTQGHQTDLYGSATYDFLLTFHSKHGTIWYRFWDKWRFRRKSQKNPTPVYSAPRWCGSLANGYWRMEL